MQEQKEKKENAWGKIKKNKSKQQAGSSEQKKATGQPISLGSLLNLL